MNESKNDTAWVQLFAKYRIAEEVENNGFVVISSTQINEFREARLMTKFDHRSQLPTIFSEHKLSILPVTRGNYLISTIETFHAFESDDIPIQRIEFPAYIQSLDFKNISSESTAINCAFVSGMIDDFLGEKNIKPTVNGRMGSGEFDFYIDSEIGEQKFRVRNSQVEIDGGFEGENSLSLFEAKNTLSKDFLIRQLYYPFRLWSKKIEKPVRPIFLTYSNGIFDFREYAFTNPEKYNSIRQIRRKKYSIWEGEFDADSIGLVLKNIELSGEPELPFPQADSFPRVINLCEFLYNNHQLTKNEITDNYDFDERQTNYYADAGRYLGLIEKKRESGETHYFLTEKAKEIFSESMFDRQVEFVKLMLSRKAFRDTFELAFESDVFPEREKIVAIMKNSKLYKIDSDSTFRRRAFTVASWVKWILDLIK